MVYPTLRIAKVLQEHLIEKGSAVALAKAIHAAAGKPGKAGKRQIVDRRKLKAIVDTLDDPELDVALSLRELDAIDAYLELFGEGLAYKPLFDKPDILTAMADSRHVSFFLGAKPESDGFRINLSHWDVQAMAEVQRGLNALSDRLRIETHDIQLSDNLREVKTTLRKPELKKLLGAKGPSLVCLGTSRSTPIAETMLAEMFGLPEFTAPKSEAGARRVPFHFVWKEDLPGLFPSFLHLDSDGAKALYPIAGRNVAKDTSALILPDREPLLDGLTQGESGTYGVIAVQRRPGGQVWCVLAGVTGPATLACAIALPKIEAKLDARAKGQNGRLPVVWAVVHAGTRVAGRSGSSAPIELRPPRIVEGPHVWTGE